MKSSVPLAAGHMLYWLDMSAFIPKTKVDFKFTYTPKSVEITCGLNTWKK